VPADGETAAGAASEEEIEEWQLVVVVLAEPVEQVVLVGQVVLVEHTEVAEPVELGAEVVAVAAVVAAEYRPPQQRAVHYGQWSPEHIRLCEKMKQMLLSINEYGLFL
jgi:hypothetical protein